MKRIALAIIGCCVLIGSAAYGQSLSDRINYVMKKRAQAEARNTSKSHMLSVLVYQDITVDFLDTPARDVFTYFQTVLKINIVGRYNDDRTGAGIDPDTEITLSVENKPALTVLEMVLEQCETYGEECTWQLRNGFVEVGTKERLGMGSAREIRYYPIRDLLFEPPMFDNAPDLDIGSALNQGGGGFGGGGGGGGGGFGGGGGGGFGGGGGGSGGGGGGGSGGGGGGSIFGDPEDDPDRMGELEKAQAIMDLIRETVETDRWVSMGGESATMRYYQGVLIIRAPDYIHRQIDGYPFAIRPVRTSTVVQAEPSKRYVTFAGTSSEVKLAETRAAEARGEAGSEPGGESATPPAKEKTGETPDK